MRVVGPMRTFFRRFMFACFAAGALFVSYYGAELPPDQAAQQMIDAAPTITPTPPSVTFDEVLGIEIVVPPAGGIGQETVRRLAIATAVLVLACLALGGALRGSIRRA